MLWWSKYEKWQFFMFRWSILCKPTYLHELPYCNNTHRYGSPYVDKTCIIHTWIQSGHMHVHACPKSAYVCDMHDKHVTLKFWATWSEEEERILLSQRSKFKSCWSIPLDSQYDTRRKVKFPCPGNV